MHGATIKIHFYLRANIKHEPDIFVALTINILIPCMGMYLDGTLYFSQGNNYYKLK
jgi:hypothetical protein